MCNIFDLFDFTSHNIDVDIFCLRFSKSGAYYEEIRKRIKGKLLGSHFISTVYYGGSNLIYRILRRGLRCLPKNLLSFLQSAVMQSYSNKYDVVISMEEGIATYVASYIKAPRKIAWVRCMYDRYQELYPDADEAECYKKFDDVVCVSNPCKQAFVNAFPQYKEKTRCIPNTQNNTSILQKSTANAPHIICPPECFCVVSIGRLDVVKQFDKIPQIASEIEKRGKRFHWYILGEGGERKNIEDAIEKYGVSERVFLMGEVNNPYPEIKRADLVAITSSSESFCNVVAESEIIGTRVISTPFPAIYDSMRNRDTGIICPLKEFSEMILKVMDETVLPSNIEDKQPNTDYDALTRDFVAALEELLCE